MQRFLLIQAILIGLLTRADVHAQQTTDASNAASPTIDYHSVRGRAGLRSSSGRLEGELHLQMTGKSRAQTLLHYGDQWSGGAHLLWDGAVGETMETSFEVDRDGEYDVVMQFTAAPDYGVFDASMNGRAVKKGIDLFGPRVDLAPLLKLEDIPFKAGRQSLHFNLTGANPRAKKFQGRGYLLGLDYLQLVRKNASPEDESPGADQGARNPRTKTTPPSSPAAAPLKFNDLLVTLRKYCLSCHHGKDAEGDVHLGRWTSRERLLQDIHTTRRVREVVDRHEMPPEEKTQPPTTVRLRLVSALDAVIDEYLKDYAFAAPVVMRRMNRYEYNNAVRDLLELKGDIYPLPEKTIRADRPYFNPASGRFPDAVQVGNRTLGKNQIERQILTGVSPFAIDLQSEGGFNNRGDELSVSPILLKSFLELGRAVVHSPEFDGYCRNTESFFSSPREASREQHILMARERLGFLLERAFRRPTEPETLDRYHAFFVQRLRDTDSFAESMKDVAAAVLASPKFVFLSEFEQTDNQVQSLDAYSLATRLSFFLWSSIPDETLLEAARDGSLLDPQELDAQVTRMLRDPRSQALSQNFARQWLRLDQLVAAVPDFDRFPEYYSRIGCEQWKFGLQTMVEPLLLFESIMVEDRSIMLLVDCNFSYRSDELQSWYADQSPFAKRPNRNRFNTNQQAFRKRLLKDRREGGVITAASTLTMTSAPLRTSPIVRGAWVSTVIFNRPPPPPPDVVPPIEADEKELEARGLTLRERLKQHQANPSCVACHAKIDPLGFALENYDAVGRWRDSYASGLPIDASGRLFGKTRFHDAVGLKDAILDRPELFLRAFSEHLLSYSLGRRLELADAPSVDRILNRVAADHGQFTTVVRAIVQSHPFRHRSRRQATKDPK